MPVGVVGTLSRDVVGGAVRVGGAPYYAARALRLLDRDARIVTRCAARDRTPLLRPLVALGVPVTWSAAATTPSFSFRYEGDRRIMAVDALGEPWTAADVAGWAGVPLASCRWVHVGALAQGEFPPQTLAALARGRRVSLDGQGLVRVARVGPLELAPPGGGGGLEHVSVLKLAEEEAETLVGRVAAPALRELGVPEIVVTVGSAGSLVYAGGRLERVRARPATGRVDPTGAGDAFAAAYVVHREAGERPLSAARHATAIVGALLSRSRR